MTPQPAARVRHDSRAEEILALQVRLLYGNVNTAFIVTLVAATILARLQWGTVKGAAVAGWWSYMLLVAAGRYSLSWRYRKAVPERDTSRAWGIAFAIGAGFSGAGWGAAGIFLYPAAQLNHQVFLVFVLGGMMLGAASLLSPRPEAFLAFLVPAGLGPALRLLLQGDQTHLAMGALAALFTLATIFTTLQIYRTLDASLRLQFENSDLVEDLKAAKQQTDALNEALEQRVEERTAELRETAEQLRAEIVQREQVEEELLRSRKLESIGILAGGIAHDFNNFLTVVQGNVEMAQSQLDPGSPVQGTLEETAAACRRAAFLSSQLLTFAKGGAPVRRPVSTARLVMDAVQLARAGSAVSVEVNLAEDLRFANVDPGQIGQALHNILLNARQAMPEGGIIEVSAQNVISPDDTEPRVRISIRDYGCGIAADVLPRIFDPYFTNRPGARGLGLATAYAVVSKHGGRISVASRVGHGTEFTIELPASAEPVPAQPPVASRVERGTERLLVMDDEEALRNLLKAVLTRLGYEVQTAADGAEAIAIYEEAIASGGFFDAVLLDLTVAGGMGGLEAVARLRELDPSVKLIVSSGYSDAPVMSDFAGYGFDAVIPKPWTSAQLAEVFRKVLTADRDRTSS